MEKVVEKLRGRNSIMSSPADLRLHLQRENKILDSLCAYETFEVEACTADIDYEIIASKIEAGGCYEIMDFRVNKMRGQYRVVPHDTQVVFTGKTTFKKRTSVFPPIPRHRFYLQDYNSFYPRLNRVDILTEKHTFFTTSNSNFFFQIYFSYRREELRVTLWTNVVESFSSLSAEAFNPPIMIVLTSLKVKLYLDNIVLNSTGSLLFFIDPDIVELNAYKSMTIHFLCKACVKRFDTRYDWWYSACPNCAKQMQKDPTTGQLVCQKHGSQIPTAW
ncbi:hypothetical protein C1H46_023177 [Malus baccata]|uniref:Replication factor A C-terminal domain-containing protein n=1 Tax=Malus baccata TaxID=106549 RepID=A0A540LXM8_MALBA|nr:hypothetical protein C1H46_023177 [Malus baccata]